MWPCEFTIQMKTSQTVVIASRPLSLKNSTTKPRKNWRRLPQWMACCQVWTVYMMFSTVLTCDHYRNVEQVIGADNKG